MLLADGRPCAIADLQVGERVYGTVEGCSRRYVATEVLAHWRTLKPAYRVALDDGTELVASGDHRFLTRHGFKHVAHDPLAVGDRLVGTGPFAPPAAVDDDYRRGYLSGLTRGEADVAVALEDAVPVASARASFHLRALGLAPSRPLARAVAPGAALAATLDAAPWRAGGGSAPVRAATPDEGAQLGRLVSWPWHPNAAWCRGFLAGVYDADGSYVRGMLRLSNNDPAIIQRSADGLLACAGFQSVIEDRGLEHESNTRN